MAVAALPIGLPTGPRRFAVLGAGFGGLSVAWHLLQHTSALAPVCVDLFDEAGVGGGASGVSGGLLHPYNPKGKLLWKGAEGWTAALRLLAVAEAVRCKDSTVETTGLDEGVDSTAPLAWRRGILRLAREDKHAVTFKKTVELSILLSSGDNTWLGEISQNVEIQNHTTKITCLGALEVGSLVPGLVLPSDGLALHIPQAINIHPQRYLEALWLACEEYAIQASLFGSPGTKALLRRENVNSLSILAGSYEAVIVCFGAQTQLLPELADNLPLSTCRGVVAELHTPRGSSEQYLSGAPNLLSSTWLAVQGENNLLLGATKDWGSTNPSPFVSDEEASVALEKLFAGTVPFYPSITKWKVNHVRAGLRAMPPRSALGSLPLAGCIDKLVQGLLDRHHLVTPSSCSQTTGTKWWLLCGFGSRGLIHHGWLGEQMAKAVIYQNEIFLPKELKQW